jgi:tetratricopeptide (TPR) repeat protein
VLAHRQSPPPQGSETLIPHGPGFGEQVIREKLAAEFPGEHYQHAAAASCAAVAVLLLTGLDPEYLRAARAVELLERATRLNPQDADYWQLLGLACYRHDDLQGSLKAFGKARELGRQQGPMGFVIAMAFWKLGEKDVARQWYARSVKWSEQNETEPALRGLRAEAAELLGLTEAPPPREVVRPAKH